ncbi:M28 family peptidase [Rhodanobacter sp. AS-Z3]|uniref:M28 family peptidase n=1 Tax=Rhodanobacter sp. AS-Z3 TaxID=3031330 RepID=UPI0024789CF2|nr:M28 family peptidase [Rhodanobacter sp. AS-Z3]WEN15075.1 M28 family peptidase [Rhodanobacter sp. AS-Z3]
MKSLFVVFAGLLLMASTATRADVAASRLSQISDPDTRAWWQATEALSSDAMTGRDIGSAGYDHAAALVAKRFAAAGLKPAGENGTWFQPIRFDDWLVSTEGTHIAVGQQALRLLHDLSVRPSPGMPTTLDAPMMFGGYCSPGTLGDAHGKLVICYGWRRAGHTTGGERLKAVQQAGALGMLSLADAGFTAEPMRWPVAYARDVAPVGAAAPVADHLLLAQLNADALAAVIAGSGHDAAQLLAAAVAGKPLPCFDVPTHFRAHFQLQHRVITSANVLGLLPGTDAAVAKQTIVVSAHLDGYGRGESVQGDDIYNGTLDDAAYVALLEQLAARRHGQGFRRPVLFAAFTGEEKGLLGSRWFVAHPTVPMQSIAADINLDQVRPIFPLDLLTVHALDDSTLGDTVRTVATAMGIAVQLDPEPERQLLRRSDHWPFLQAGVPSTGFVFGYRPGSDAERKYRHWYQVQYHRPQDDLGQPMDWAAAGKFNRFFYALVESVADGDAAPGWKAGSPLKPPAAKH